MFHSLKFQNYDDVYVESGEWLVGISYYIYINMNVHQSSMKYLTSFIIFKNFWFQLDTLKGWYYNPLVHRYDPGPCDCDKLCSDSSSSFDSHQCVGGNSFCCDGSRGGHALLSAGERCTPDRYCCPVGLACVDATGQYYMTAGSCGRPSCPSECSFLDNECYHDARSDTGNGEVESGNGNCAIVPQWQ